MGKRMEPEERGAPDGLWSSVQRHPIIAGTLVSCAVLGAALGFVLLTQEWSALRRILAGAVAGGGVGLLITATKMFG